MLKNNPLAAALRFLTIFPVPGRMGTGEKGLLKALPYFPLVGVLLGLLAFALGQVCWLFLDHFLASVLLVLTLVLFSGGLHLDGLADTADGFFSSRPRARILEIMRDSRIGVMGVFWLFAVLLLKIAAFSGMSSKEAGLALFLMPVAGRSLMVVVMAILPYVREEGGLATLFYQQATGWKALWALAVLTLVAWFSAGVSGLAAVGVCLFVVLLFAWYCAKKIGGATGDTLGAGCELAELVVALVFALR
jgi:adenosylcobinamide-GDP ribazoletransferase